MNQELSFINDITAIKGFELKLFFKLDRTEFWYIKKIFGNYTLHHIQNHVVILTRATKKP